MFYVDYSTVTPKTVSMSITVGKPRQEGPPAADGSHPVSPLQDAILQVMYNAVERTLSSVRKYVMLWSGMCVATIDVCYCYCCH